MSKYHKILGIPVDATKAAIKKAYRNLASKHHPDKGGDEEKFKEIQEAYDRVSHPEKYKDEILGGFGSQHGPRGSFWDNITVNINSSDGIDAHFQFAEHLRRQHVQNIRLQFELTLESTLHDQTRSIHIPEYNIPPMEITIPAGIRNGDAISYANIPHVEGYAQRALVVQFYIRPHKDFEVINNVHLIKHEIVDALDAMVGTTLTVTTIDGTTLAVKVPAGAQNGTKLKIPAKGLKYKDSPTLRGDMYVEISISIPQLSDEEKEIITKLQDKR